MDRFAILDAVINSQPTVQKIARYNELSEKWLKNLIIDYSGCDSTYEEESTKKKYRFISTLSNYRAVRQHGTPAESCWRYSNYSFDCIVDLTLCVDVDGVVYRT